MYICVYIHISSASLASGWESELKKSNRARSARVSKTEGFQGCKNYKSNGGTRQRNTMCVRFVVKPVKYIIMCPGCEKGFDSWVTDLFYDKNE
jgi:hypothetical protein